VIRLWAFRIPAQSHRDRPLWLKSGILICRANLPAPPAKDNRSEGASQVLDGGRADRLPDNGEDGHG
jgi:hypothetical protein